MSALAEAPEQEADSLYKELLVGVTISSYTRGG